MAYSQLGASFLKPNLVVRNMWIRELGTYNPQYNRPYRLDSSNGKGDRLMERIERSSIIDGNLIAGLSTDVIQQQVAATDKIEIVHGWDERRFAFMLEVEQHLTTGSITAIVLQGYTDRADYSLDGTINPDTDFIINSYIMVNRGYNRNTGRTQDVVVEAANVVAGKYVKTYSQDDQLYAMRPSDLIVGIESMSLKDAYASYSRATFEDSRVGVSQSGSFLSNRRNNKPSSYLAKTLQSYRQSTSLGDYGMRQSDLMGTTANLLIEPEPGDIDFLRALANVTGMPGTTSFRLRDLADIDPDLRSSLISSQRIRLIELKAAERAKLHRADQTDDWGGAGYSQWAATVFNNSVASIMMDLYITRLEIFCTNSGHGGIPEIKVTDARSIMDIDLRDQVAMLKERIDRETLLDISDRGRETYYISASINLFGETRIGIEIAGESNKDYCVPSFSDSVLIPTMTGSRSIYERNAEDMNSMFGMLSSQTRGTGSVSVSNNF